MQSYKFRSVSISSPIPRVQLYPNLTLKIQGQSHGWGQIWKSQHGSNIHYTHNPFVPGQLVIAFKSYHLLKILPSKSRVKVMGDFTFQGHKVGITSHRITSPLFHVNLHSQSWDKAIYQFHIENTGSKWNDHDVAELQVYTITKTFKRFKSIQWFQRYGLCEVWAKCCLIWTVFGPCASPCGPNWQITMKLQKYSWRQAH